MHRRVAAGRDRPGRREVERLVFPEPGIGILRPRGERDEQDARSHSPSEACILHGSGSDCSTGRTYVLTRPLGASLADWMGKSTADGGLGWGPGPVSVTLAAMIVAGVAVVTATRSDVQVPSPIG